MLQRRRARKLIDRAQPFAAEPLLAVANFTWVGRRHSEWAGGLPDWTLIGAGPTRLWIIESDPMRPDTGASLIGSWPLGEVQMTEERCRRTLGPIPSGFWRAMRFEFPDRDPVLLQPLGREVYRLMNAMQSGVRWDELVQVALTTSAPRPHGENVFIALTYDDDTTVHVGLGESEGLLPRLKSLPDFDDETFVRVTGGGGDPTAVLWRRDPV